VGIVVLCSIITESFSKQSEDLRRKVFVFASLGENQAAYVCYQLVKASIAKLSGPANLRIARRVLERTVAPFQEH
jgi:hypothetical protein